jgi:hypothetical protein
MIWQLGLNMVGADRVLYGIWPEITAIETEDPDAKSTRPAWDSPSLEVTEVAFRKGLAGVHLWRLNSDNLKFENEVQILVHGFVHRPDKTLEPPALAAIRQKVLKEWTDENIWFKVKAEGSRRARTGRKGKKEEAS